MELTEKNKHCFRPIKTAEVLRDIAVKEVISTSENPEEAAASLAVGLTKTFQAFDMLSPGTDGEMVARLIYDCLAMYKEVLKNRGLYEVQSWKKEKR